MLKKRIPTIVGLILLLAGVVGGVIFINEGTDFLPRAAPEYTPQKVKITNITDAGFVISWVTQEPALGFVNYSDNPLSLSSTAVDDRDQLAGVSGEYRTHYITLQNLTAGKTYYFKLGSQNDQLYDNNGQPFAVVLPASITNRPSSDSAFGTIVTAVDTPAEGAIIYLTMDTATPLSALAKQNGNWIADISLARAPDLSAFADYDPTSTQINMLVQSNEGETATAITTTGNHQPVPTIIIGQSNIFISDDSETSAPTTVAQPQPTATTYSDTSTAASKFNLNPLSISDDDSVSVTTIPPDGIISSLQPQFEGQGPPDTTLTITVHSPIAYTGSVTTDTAGRWQWLAPNPLDQGDHVITITYTDTQNIIRSIEKPFVIATASLQQVDLSYAATPSATPVATPQPTPESTPEPTPESTPRTTTVATGSADIIAGNTTAGAMIAMFGVILISLGLISRFLLPTRQ